MNIYYNQNINFNIPCIINKENWTFYIYVIWQTYSKQLSKVKEL